MNKIFLFKKISGRSNSKLIFVRAENYGQAMVKLNNKFSINEMEDVTFIEEIDFVNDIFVRPLF